MGRGLRIGVFALTVIKGYGEYLFDLGDSSAAKVMWIDDDGLPELNLELARTALHNVADTFAWLESRIFKGVKRVCVTSKNDYDHVDWYSCFCLECSFTAESVLSESRQMRNVLRQGVAFAIHTKSADVRYAITGLPYPMPFHKPLNSLKSSDGDSENKDPIQPATRNFKYLSDYLDMLKKVNSKGTHVSVSLDGLRKPHGPIINVTFRNSDKDWLVGTLNWIRAFRIPKGELCSEIVEFCQGNHRPQNRNDVCVFGAGIAWAAMLKCMTPAKQKLLRQILAVGSLVGTLVEYNELLTPDFNYEAVLPCDCSKPDNFKHSVIFHGFVLVSGHYTLLTAETDLTKVLHQLGVPLVVNPFKPVAPEHATTTLTEVDQRLKDGSTIPDRRLICTADQALRVLRQCAIAQTDLELNGQSKFDEIQGFDISDELSETLITITECASSVANEKKLAELRQTHTGDERYDTKPMAQRAVATVEKQPVKFLLSLPSSFCVMQEALDKFLNEVLDGLDLDHPMSTQKVQDIISTRYDRVYKLGRAALDRATRWSKDHQLKGLLQLKLEKVMKRLASLVVTAYTDSNKLVFKRILSASSRNIRLGVHLILSGSSGSTKRPRDPKNDSSKPESAKMPRTNVVSRAAATKKSTGPKPVLRQTSGNVEDKDALFGSSQSGESSDKMLDSNPVRMSAPESIIVASNVENISVENSTSNAPEGESAARTEVYQALESAGLTPLAKKQLEAPLEGEWGNYQQTLMQNLIDQRNRELAEHPSRVNIPLPDHSSSDEDDATPPKDSQGILSSSRSQNGILEPTGQTAQTSNQQNPSSRDLIEIDEDDGIESRVPADQPNSDVSIEKAIIAENSPSIEQAKQNTELALEAHNAAGSNINTAADPEVTPQSGSDQPEPAILEEHQIVKAPAEPSAIREEADTTRSAPEISDNSQVIILEEPSDVVDQPSSTHDHLIVIDEDTPAIVVESSRIEEITSETNLVDLTVQDRTAMDVQKDLEVARPGLVIDVEDVDTSKTDATKILYDVIDSEIEELVEATTSSHQGDNTYQHASADDLSSILVEPEDRVLPIAAGDAPRLPDNSPILTIDAGEIPYNCAEQDLNSIPPVIDVDSDGLEATQPLYNEGRPLPEDVNVSETALPAEIEPDPIADIVTEVPAQITLAENQLSEVFTEVSNDDAILEEVSKEIATEVPQEERQLEASGGEVQDSGACIDHIKETGASTVMNISKTSLPISSEIDQQSQPLVTSNVHDQLSVVVDINSELGAEEELPVNLSIPQPRVEPTHRIDTDGHGQGIQIEASAATDRDGGSAQLLEISESAEEELENGEMPESIVEAVIQCPESFQVPPSVVAEVSRELRGDPEIEEETARVFVAHDKTLPDQQAATSAADLEMSDEIDKMTPDNIAHAPEQFLETLTTEVTEQGVATPKNAQSKSPLLGTSPEANTVATIEKSKRMSDELDGDLLGDGVQLQSDQLAGSPKAKSSKANVNPSTELALSMDVVEQSSQVANKSTAVIGATSGSDVSKQPAPTDAVTESVAEPTPVTDSAEDPAPVVEKVATALEDVSEVIVEAVEEPTDTIEHVHQKAHHPADAESNVHSSLVVDNSEPSCNDLTASCTQTQTVRADTAADASHEQDAVQASVSTTQELTPPSVGLDSNAPTEIAVEDIALEAGDVRRDQSAIGLHTVSEDLALAVEEPEHTPGDSSDQPEQNLSCDVAESEVRADEGRPGVADRDHEGDEDRGDLVTSTNEGDDNEPVDQSLHQSSLAEGEEALSTVNYPEDRSQMPRPPRSPLISSAHEDILTEPSRCVAIEQQNFSGQDEEPVRKTSAVSVQSSSVDHINPESTPELAVQNRTAEPTPRPPSLSSGEYLRSRPKRLISETLTMELPQTSPRQRSRKSPNLPVLVRSVVDICEDTPNASTCASRRPRAAVSKLQNVPSQSESETSSSCAPAVTIPEEVLMHVDTDSLIEELKQRGYVARMPRKHSLERVTRVDLSKRRRKTPTARRLSFDKAGEQVSSAYKTTSPFDTPLASTMSDDTVELIRERVRSVTEKMLRPVPYVDLVATTLSEPNEIQIIKSTKRRASDCHILIGPKQG